MEKIICESFRQNPDKIGFLMDTGCCELTHKQDGGIWRTEFPRILMELRNKIRNVEKW